MKIRGIFAGVIGTPTPTTLVEVPIPKGLVLMPGKFFNSDLVLDSGTTSTHHNMLYPIVVVDCSDLAEVSDHRFRFDDVDGLRHSFGFN